MLCRERVYDYPLITRRASKNRSSRRRRMASPMWPAKSEGARLCLRTGASITPSPLPPTVWGLTQLRPVRF